MKYFKVFVIAFSLLLLGQVYATSDCVKEDLFKEEIKMYQDKPVIFEIVNLLGDGYHVVNFKDQNLIGNDYFTVKKVDGRVLWLRKGNCAEGNYMKYNVNTDNQKVLDIFSNPDVDVLYEGYKVMNQIEGITLFQKLNLFKIALFNQNELLKLKADQNG